MTRLNLVPPEELMDQHLFAEFREIKMVPKSLQRSLMASNLRGETYSIFRQGIPREYTLNTGHVKFFYDKGRYLRKRYEAIKAELSRRDINFNEDSLLDPDRVFDSLDDSFNNDYEPTPAAIAIVRSRIAERIAIKPTWYRYYGRSVNKDNGA